MNCVEQYKNKWVKQYYKGYWKTVEIYPKNRDSSLVDNSTSDDGGYWALMKKGLTEKMRFSLDSSYCDLSLCNLVSDEEEKMITLFFEAHRRERIRFEQYQFDAKPAIYNVWINIDTEHQERNLKIFLGGLQIPFNTKTLKEVLTKCNIAPTKPPSTHVLNLFYYPWQFDEEGNYTFSSFSLMSVQQMSRKPSP